MGTLATGSGTGPGRLGRALRLLALLCGLALLAFSLRGLEPARCARLLAGLGPAALVVPVPFFVTLLLDTLASSRLIAAQGGQVGYGRLLRLRFASEALVLGLPSGSLLADGASARWLQGGCGLSWGQSLAAVLARKCLLPLAQGLVLGTGALLLWRQRAPLLYTLLAALGTAALVGAAAAGLRAFARGGALDALYRQVRRWPFLGRLALGRRGVARQADSTLRRGLSGAALVPLALLLACALIDVFESWLLLALLGAPLPIARLLPADALLSLVRVAAFFVPAGLGVQDSGYVWFLQSAGPGAAETLAAAFLVLKRGKEALFVALGVLIGGPRAFLALAGEGAWQTP